MAQDGKHKPQPGQHAGEDSKHRYTGTKLALATLSADDFKYILQMCDNGLIASQAVTTDGSANAMQKRLNGATKQGGDPGPDPNTQPEATPSTFNKSGYPVYTPSPKIAAFIAEVNAWDKANLHTSNKHTKP